MYKERGAIRMEDGAANELFKLLLRRTDSDLAAYGAADPVNRKLHWLHVEGGISGRTELIRQKLTAGLTGAAIRSGRLLKIEQGWDEKERFKLGEAILLTEKLSTAAAVPVNGNAEGDGIRVLLIGRRRDVSYEEEQLKEAEAVALRLADLPFPFKG